VALLGIVLSGSACSFGEGVVLGYMKHFDTMLVNACTFTKQSDRPHRSRATESSHTMLCLWFLWVNQAFAKPNASNTTGFFF